MNQPTVHPSPKARFLAIKHCVDQHRELIQRPDFQLAVDNALQQMMWTEAGGMGPISVPGNDAASKFYKLQGAHDFVRTLVTLAEVQAPLPAQDTGSNIHESFK